MTTTRRYDIDWLRVIAIGLLLVYHTGIGFQAWGGMIGFIASDHPLEALQIPMSMMNIWRIPLLFFVSGMGVYFAMKKRNWKQLFKERTGRILVPFIFGIFFIVPIHAFIWQHYYQLNTYYAYNPGHLWFLGNIFAYVVLLSPVLYLIKKHEQGKIVRMLKKLMSSPVGLIVVVLVLFAEARILDPNPYELYAMTWHGFFLGLLAFFFGFCFVLTGNGFWEMILKWRWGLLAGVLILFSLRLFWFELVAPTLLLVIESVCWITMLFAFGYKYLNQPGRTLTYLSKAAYPIYILHMVFLYLGSLVIFPLELHALLQFLLVLVFTFAGCFITYEIIRRINVLRPLFGLKIAERPKSGISANAQPVQ